MASAKTPKNRDCSEPVEAVVCLRHPGSHRSQNLHQLSHVASEVGEVRLHAEVLQTHSSQNALVLLRLLNQELPGQVLQVSQPLSGKQEEVLIFTCNTATLSKKKNQLICKTLILQ